MKRTESLRNGFWANHPLALALRVLIAFLVVAGSLWITVDMSTGLIPADGTTNGTGRHQ